MNSDTEPTLSPGVPERNTSAKPGDRGIFFTTKDTNDPKKFHGMDKELQQSEPLPMKFFRDVSGFSLSKKNSTVTSFTDSLQPETSEQRRELRGLLEEFLKKHPHIAPVELRHLEGLAGQFLQEHSLPDSYRDWCMIFINNILWGKVIRRIPRERRLLMLPFCLRHSSKCEADYDEFGLLCKDCGRCRIPELRQLAESFGLTTLVAESSGRVAEWVQSGEVQAVIGVSCLHALSKAFPLMNLHAVPGIAIPLNRAGCQDTDFDREVLIEALAIEEENVLTLPSYDEVNARVQELFSPEFLQRKLLSGKCPAVEFSQEVVRVMVHGKHYRPLLVFQTWLAMSESPEIPAWLDLVALAVECFHKASLVHDDIEDDDPLRYGEPTVHVRQGLAVAVNIGDYLLGEGYRLLASAEVPAKIRGEILGAAAQGHCELALGQGQELEWREQEMSMEMLLDVFRLKTAPAFRVALEIGALAAGRLQDCQNVFPEFSEALGIAYQLLDDLDDKAEDHSSAVFLCAKTRQISAEEARSDVRAQYFNYREKAFATLERLQSQPLKSLLFRMTAKILDATG